MILLKNRKIGLIGLSLSVFFAVFLVGIPFSDAVSVNEMYWTDAQANSGAPVRQFDVVSGTASSIGPGSSAYVRAPSSQCEGIEEDCNFQAYLLVGDIIGVSTRVVHWGGVSGGSGTCPFFVGNSSVDCTFALSAGGTNSFDGIIAGERIWLVWGEITDEGTQAVDFINFLDSDNACPSLCNYTAEHSYWEELPENVFNPGEQGPQNISRTMLGNSSFEWHITYVSGSDPDGPYELEIEFQYYNDLSDVWAKVGVLAETGTLESGITQFIFTETASVSDFSSDFKTATISATGITGDEWCFSASLLDGSDFASAHTAWQPMGGLCIVPSSATAESETDFTGFIGFEQKQCDLTHFGGCIINAFAFLFIPQEDVLQKWVSVKGSLANSFPFVYIFDLTSVYSNLNANSTASFAISISSGTTGFDDDLVFFTSDSFGDETFMSSATWATLRFLMGVAVYIGFAFFVIFQVKGLARKI